MRVDAQLSSNASLYGYAQYDPLYFAWCLFPCLTKGHNFVDGNKRVSWAAMMTVLHSEGLDVSATDDEAVSFVIAVAASTLSEREAQRWIEDRLRARR